MQAPTFLYDSHRDHLEAAHTRRLALLRLSDERRSRAHELRTRRFFARDSRTAVAPATARYA
jgi:hypothetical protein